MEHSEASKSDEDPEAPAERVPPIDDPPPDSERQSNTEASKSDEDPEAPAERVPPMDDPLPESQPGSTNNNEAPPKTDKENGRTMSPGEDTAHTGVTATSTTRSATSSFPPAGASTNRSVSSSTPTSVSELRLQEKFNLISGKTLWFLANVPRLKIPSIRVSDGPHGVRKPIKELSLQRAFPATCFPTAAALACSWDPDVLKDVGRALRTECIHYDIHVLLGPGMNLKRHPCGGRNFEYFSEDPYLTGKLATAYIQGVEATGQVGACAKHFAVNNQESHRFVVNAKVDERTLRELYLRHFEMVVKEASPKSMMCAYNKVNGQYCSEHMHLNVKILREEWGYDGVLMSDWGAVNDRVAGIRSQLDLEMPGSHGVHNREIRTAMHNGLITEAEVDTCAQRVLSLIDKVRPDRGADSVHTTKSLRSDNRPVSWPVQHDIAKKTALECAVLLKNQDNFLPLDQHEVESVAVIGEFGKTFPRYQGMGSSHVNAEWALAAYDEAFRFCDNVTFAPGYDIDDENTEERDEVLLEEAVKVAAEAQVTILCVGLPEICESEGFDRPHMMMPAQHRHLIAEICKVNPNVIVVLSNGASFEMPWVDEPKAIFESFLLGEAGGAAIVDLIFGLSSPNGKLPETIPVRKSDVLADKYFPGTRDTVEHREGLNVGYRYFDSADVEVRFPFGHGLTYTTFEYSGINVRILEDETKSKNVEISFDLTNTGEASAKEIVQCYVHQVDASVYRPKQELKAFDKLFLHPGESKKVKLELAFDAFAFYDIGESDWVVEPGAFEICIGASSRDIRLTQKIEFAKGQQASEAARTSYPPKQCLPLEDVDDETFARRFQLTPSQMKDRATPTVAPNFHRNSLLKEVSASTALGKLLMWAVWKGACADIQPGPSLKRDEKIMQAAVRNLPLRTMVLFGGGALSFELMDAMIASMNGAVGKALCLYIVAFTPFRKKTRYNPDSTW